MVFETYGSLIDMDDDDGRSHFLHFKKAYHFLHLFRLILKRFDLSGDFGILQKQLKSGESSILKYLFDKIPFSPPAIGTTPIFFNLMF